MTDKEVDVALLKERTRILSERMSKVETAQSEDYDELKDMIHKVDEKVANLKIWMLLLVAGTLWQIVQSIVIEQLHR